MTPRFSILLPTHDRADVIGFAVRSALRQTETDFEILVVCDGCTAETADAVRSFEDERIRLFDMPKAPGFGWANRNLALRQACGELVAFLGDDDLWLPDHLERLGAVFVDERIEWAYSRPLWMADDGVVVPLAFDLRRPRDYEQFMTVGNSIPATCVVHRRSALERYGYWPDHLWQGERAPAIDWELWRRMIGPSGGANLEYVPDPTCIHFRADWRMPETWMIRTVRAWMDGAHAGWWPPGLVVAPGMAASPQAAAWERLEADTTGWMTQIRAAVVTVVDGFASDSVTLSEQLPALQERLAALEDRLASQAAAGAETERRLAEQSAHSAALEEQLVDQAGLVSSLHDRLAGEAAFSASILTSTSWRVMAPARRAGRLLRTVARRSRPMP